MEVRLASNWDSLLSIWVSLSSTCCYIIRQLFLTRMLGNFTVTVIINGIEIFEV